jgi:hypothetical protein
MRTSHAFKDRNRFVELSCVGKRHRLYQRKIDIVLSAGVHDFCPPPGGALCGLQFKSHQESEDRARVRDYLEGIPSTRTMLLGSHRESKPSWE